MRALLLSAGLGTRLRPITNSVPKCLVEIDRRPLLDYWIELLSKGGIVNILINLHYLPDAVRAYVKSCRFPVQIAMEYEQKLLGTGGTILKNNTYFRGKPAMLIHADNLSLFEVPAFIERFETRGKNIEMTMMTFRTDAPETCGVVEIDKRGLVQSFHEKIHNPPGNLANAAVYILSPAVISFLSEIGNDAIDFSTQVLPHFLGRINTFHNDVYHRDIGTMESYLAAQREYPNVIARRAGLLEARE